MLKKYAVIVIVKFLANVEESLSEVLEYIQEEFQTLYF